MKKTAVQQFNGSKVLAPSPPRRGGDVRGGNERARQDFLAAGLNARLSAIEKDLEVLRSKVALLRRGLEESLKLQSHYAALLNQYDGGERKCFDSAEAWVKQVSELGVSSE